MKLRAPDLCRGSNSQNLVAPGDLVGVGIVGLGVDVELLAFFVKVAAFEAEGAGGAGHVSLVAVELGEHYLAFVGE